MYTVQPATCIIRLSTALLLPLHGTDRQTDTTPFQYNRSYAVRVIIIINGKQICIAPWGRNCTRQASPPVRNLLPLYTLTKSSWRPVANIRWKSIKYSLYARRFCVEHCVEAGLFCMKTQQQSTTPQLLYITSLSRALSSSFISVCWPGVQSAWDNHVLCQMFTD